MMAHYFDDQPQVAHQIDEITVSLRGCTFTFKTDRGVFSRQRLDFGSRLLIEAVAEAEKSPTGRLLDLGCGYGAIGIIMKRLFPQLEVVLCDVNQRALDLARQNAFLNRTDYIEILKSDGMADVPGPFDLVLTNPPIRQGKAVVYRFFREAAAGLTPGGRLYVVIRKKQGAPSALKELQGIFASAEVVQHKAGYWVIRAQNPLGSVQG